MQIFSNEMPSREKIRVANPRTTDKAGNRSSKANVREAHSANVLTSASRQVNILAKWIFKRLVKRRMRVTNGYSCIEEGVST